MSLDQENPRISLDEAASIMTSLLESLEDHGPDNEQETIEKYMSAGKSLSESIDRRKFVLKEAESKINLAKSMKDELDEQIKKYRRVHESIIEGTKKIIQENPNIVFRDSMGKRVFVNKNPTPRLISNIQTNTKTYHNALDQDDLDYLISNGYEKYITNISLNVLNTSLLKEDICELGIEIPFASVVSGYQLRGMK